MDHRNEERESWPKSEKQADIARLCSEYFVTGAKSDGPFHIDYDPTVFCFVSVAGASRKRKSIDRYERSQKRARNQDEKKERKDTPKKNETTLYANVEDEHSVPDCVEQIEFQILANKVFLVLMKLKLGLVNQDLAIRFNLNESKVSKIF